MVERNMNIKILLVDDNQTCMRLLTFAVNSLGYQTIETAVDGIEAVRKAQEYLPHLIIMDTRMPQLWGYDACRQIRETDAGKRMAIIGISDSSYRKRWLDAGADDFQWKDIMLEGGPGAEEMIQAALKRYF